MRGEIRVGLISDTHGLLRPEALAALRGSDFIIHAGDVGDPAILVELGKIAPVTVVRGNIDRGATADAWPESARLHVGGVAIDVRHGHRETARPVPATTGGRVIVSGHSHRASIEEREGVLLVNPGSAGPRRFRLPITVGALIICGGEISARVIALDPA